MKKDKEYVLAIAKALMALAAFIVSLIVIYEFYIKPDGPEIKVAFALTGTDEITIAPTVESQRAEWTDAFPLGIQVTNVGGLAAENVVLEFQAARNLALLSQGTELAPRIIFNGNGVDLASHQLSMEKINPGQTIHFDNDIYGYTENHIDLAVDVTFKDGIEVAVPVSLTVTHDITVKVSASNMPQIQLPLRLTLGKFDILAEKPREFFQYKDGELVKYRINASNKPNQQGPAAGTR